MTSLANVTAYKDIASMKTHFVYSWSDGSESRIVIPEERLSVDPYGALTNEILSIAAIKNVPVDTVVRMTATRLLLLNPPRLRDAGKSQAQNKSWDGNPSSPPTEDEIRRAWRELGLS
jgi:hypothetical protein